MSKRIRDALTDPRLLIQVAILVTALAATWGLRAGQMERLRADVDRMDNRGSAGLVAHELENEKQFTETLRRLDVLTVELAHLRADLERHDRRLSSVPCAPQP